MSDPYPHPNGGDVHLLSLNMHLFTAGRGVCPTIARARLQEIETVEGTPEWDYKERLLAWLARRSAVPQ